MASEEMLKGRTAFITGASRGIGKAIAVRLAKAGANVAIVAKTVTNNPKVQIGPRTKGKVTIISYLGPFIPRQRKSNGTGERPWQ